MGLPACMTIAMAAWGAHAQSADMVAQLALRAGATPCVGSLPLRAARERQVLCRRRCGQHARAALSPAAQRTPTASAHSLALQRRVSAG